MAPRTTAEIDRRYATGVGGRPGWEHWPRPTMPDLAPGDAPWAWDSDAFWRRRADQLAVDTERTARLGRFDVAITASAGRFWQGVVSGFPFQLIPPDARTHRVLDSRVPWWPLTTYHRRAFVPMPLPDHVRLKGDPAGGDDRHWKGLEVGAALWEAWVMRRNPLGGMACSSWVRYDLTIPWDDPDQPQTGVTAWRCPQLPLIVRWDEIQRGRIDHALFLALDDYAPEVTGPARGTDGTATGHPCRAGELLRLRDDVLDGFLSLPDRHPARVIAIALHEHGAYLGDRTWWPGLPDRRGALALTQDRRFAEGERSLGLSGLGDLARFTLDDFVVLRVT